MANFLYLNASDLSEVEEQDCTIIKARNRDEALRFAKEQEANNPEFLGYIGDGNFFVKFFCVTPEEREACDTDGSYIAPIDVVHGRVDDFFAGHREWAKIMKDLIDADRVCDSAEIERILPADMRRYMIEHSHWCDFVLINLDEVRVVA